MKKFWFIFLMILIAAVLFVVGFFLAAVFQSAKNQNSAGNINSQELAEVSGLLLSGEKSAARQLAEKINRPFFGNLAAKLVIVEFGDFQCPVCEEEFPIIREIISRYQNQIFFIYRNYPVINENSPTIAAAALCANEQDKFWPVHDRLYLGQSGGFTDEILRDIAKRSGLDLAKYDDCVKTGKYLAAVQEDFNDATVLGVSGTPTFFVNGNKLEGAVTKEQWEQVINKSLEILK